MPALAEAGAWLPTSRRALEAAFNSSAKVKREPSGRTELLPQLAAVPVTEEELALGTKFRNR